MILTKKSKLSHTQRFLKKVFSFWARKRVRVDIYSKSRTDCDLKVVFIHKEANSVFATHSRGLCKFQSRTQNNSPLLSLWAFHLRKACRNCKCICNISKSNELCIMCFHGVIHVFVCLSAGSACRRGSESVSGEEGECGARLQCARPLQLQPLSCQQLLQRRLGQLLLHLPCRSVCLRDHNIVQCWKVT